MNRIVSLILAILTNLCLAGLFGRALLHPVDFQDFIYKTGLMIFLIEFMSLHSSGMFFGGPPEAPTPGKRLMAVRGKITVIAFYSIVVVGFAAATGQWLAAVYFVASLSSKAFFSRSIGTKQQSATIAAGIAMLLLATFIVVFSASLLVHWFPFPAEVRAAKPAGQSGLFVDRPQTLMAWGVLYFSLMAVCEFFIFRYNAKKKTAARWANPVPVKN